MPGFDFNASNMKAVEVFLKSECRTADWLSVTNADLYAAYCKWCIKENIPPQTMKLLSRQLHKLGFHSGFVWTNNKTQRAWGGLTPK